jgi:hypothetical protein
MYIITVRRITSGELLKQRKGLRIAGGYGCALRASSQFALTLPRNGLRIARGYGLALPASSHFGLTLLNRAGFAGGSSS